MKWRLKYLLLSFILMISGHVNLTAQPCLPDGITFTTQSQIDSFPINYPNCTEIKGNVLIFGDDISNLYGLNVLTSIGGYLNIESNDILTNLTGLEGITSIGGFLKIGYNNALNSMSGLEGLNSIGGPLYIYYNHAISSLAGLDGVTNLGGHLNVQYNNSLISLAGMEGMTALDGGLLIGYNNSLTNLAGLEGITYIGGFLWIGYNDGMTTLEGIEGVTSVGGGFQIGYNNALTSLKGMEGVTSFDGDIYIAYNDALTDLTALNGVTSIYGDLDIECNNALPSLTGLDNIESGTINNLTLFNNDMLSTCEVESICNYLKNPNGKVQIVMNAEGCSSPAEVEEACTVGIPEQQSATQLSIYPNPFTTSTTIEYELRKISNIQFTVYNMIGEVVYETENQLMSQGSHTVTWSPSHLPRGLYYAVLRSEEGVSVVKIVKQ